MPNDDFGSLYGEFTRDAVVEDALKADAYPTYPAGKYILKPDSVKVRHGDNEMFERLYDRPFATIKGQLLDPTTGSPVGNIFVDVSWEERRMIGKKSVKVTPDIAEDVRDQKLDRESKLWGNLEKALTGDGPKMSVGDILEKLTKNTALLISLQESFKLGDSWKSTKDANIRAEYVKAGAKAFNSVNSIKAMEA